MAPAVPRTAPDHLSVPHTDDRSQYMALVSRTFIMRVKTTSLVRQDVQKGKKKKKTPPTGGNWFSYFIAHIHKHYSELNRKYTVRIL